MQTYFPEECSSTSEIIPYPPILVGDPSKVTPESEWRDTPLPDQTGLMRLPTIGPTFIIPYLPNGSKDQNDCRQIFESVPPLPGGKLPSSAMIFSGNLLSDCPEYFQLRLPKVYERCSYLSDQTTMLVFEYKSSSVRSTFVFAFDPCQAELYHILTQKATERYPSGRGDAYAAVGHHFYFVGGCYKNHDLQATFQDLFYDAIINVMDLDVDGVTKLAMNMADDLSKLNLEVPAFNLLQGKWEEDKTCITKFNQPKHKPFVFTFDAKIYALAIKKPYWDLGDRFPSFEFFDTAMEKRRDSLETSISSKEKSNSNSGSPMQGKSSSGAPMQGKSSSGAPKEEGSSCGSPKVHSSSCGSPMKDWSSCGSTKEEGSIGGSTKVEWSSYGSPKVERSSCGSPMKEGSSCGSIKVWGSSGGSTKVEGSSYGSPKVEGSSCGSPEVEGSGSGSPSTWSLLSPPPFIADVDTRCILCKEKKCLFVKVSDDGSQGWIGLLWKFDIMSQNWYNNNTDPNDRFYDPEDSEFLCSLTDVPAHHFEGCIVHNILFHFEDNETNGEARLLVGHDLRGKKVITRRWEIDLKNLLQGEGHGTLSTLRFSHIKDFNFCLFIRYAPSYRWNVNFLCICIFELSLSGPKLEESMMQEAMTQNRDDLHFIPILHRRLYFQLPNMINLSYHSKLEGGFISRISGFK